MPHFTIARASTAFDLTIDVRMRLGQCKVETLEIFLEGIRKIGTRRDRTIHNGFGPPDDPQIAHVQHALIHHGAQIATAEALCLITLAGCPGHGSIILALQHGNHALFMPARETGAGEIGIAIHRNTATTQREARDQIAGSGIGVRPGKRLAAHLFQVGNA